MRLRISRRTMRGAACLLAGLLLLLAVAFGLYYWESHWADDEVAGAGQSTSYSTANQPSLYYEGEWYALKSGLETILILGVDKTEETALEGSYVNNEQADFLLLLILDTSNSTGEILHLNRDTMTEITKLDVYGNRASTYTGQLALAHTYGSGGTDSCENTVTAVSTLLYGVEIDHYISLTMDGVSILNDLAGGVTVEILDDFSGIDDSLVYGETVTLYGQQALTYVRTRMGLEDSTNLHRMERQRQYLKALQQQLKASAQESSFTLSALLELNAYMVSDCTIDQLSRLAEQLESYEFGEYLSLDGESTLGEEYMEFYVDEEALQALVLELFYTRVDAPE